MRMTLRAALALACVAAACSASPARADFRICNRMSYVVDAAIGISDKGSVATRGWFRLLPAACHVAAPDTLPADRYFLHVKALPLYGAAPTPHGASEQLCVAEKDFVIAAASRCRSGQRSVPFVEVKPSSTETGSAIYLGEPAEYDEEQARLAGIQRLLDLAGYDAKPIDGVEGPKTNAAIDKFLRNKGLAADAINNTAIFDTLIAAAQSPTGAIFTWCNDTPYRIMAAVGVEAGDGVAAHGWYRIEPGACVHPDVAAEVKRVYSFGEAVDGEGRPLQRDGEPIRWGGSRPLCTRDTKFEASGDKDCVARGFTESGFATIDLDGSAKTFRFKNP